MLLAKIEGARLGLSLQDLMASLPEDYARNARTIRRDLEALELHFPVFPMRRNGRTVWKLVESYRGGVPQLGFSPAELMALIFSRDLLKPLDLLAAFCSSGCLHESPKKRKEGKLDPTPFPFISGSGHQDFLETASELLQRVSSELVQSALFTTWTYDGEGLSMRWDPVEDRR